MSSETRSLIGRMAFIVIVGSAIYFFLLRPYRLCSVSERLQTHARGFKGVVASIEYDHGVVSIRLVNDTSKYCFFPGFGAGLDMQYYLRVNDSVSADPYGDSVYLYQDGLVASWPLIVPKQK